MKEVITSSENEGSDWNRFWLYFLTGTIAFGSASLFL